MGGGGAKKYNRPAIAKPSNHAVESSEKPKGPGKTTFAERVKLFQNLGKKPPEAAAEVASSAPEPVVPAAVPVGQRKIAFLDLVGKQQQRDDSKFPPKPVLIGGGPTLPTIAEAASPSSSPDKALLRAEDDALPAILKSAERRRSDDRHSKMLDSKLAPKAALAEDEDEYYQEIDSEEYENCPYCNNEYSISTGTGVCSTCDSCTCDEYSHNGAKEEEEGEGRKRAEEGSRSGSGGGGAGSGKEQQQQSFGHSVAANSWNYLNSGKRSDEDNEDEDEEDGDGDERSSLSAAESVINLLNEVHQAAAAATASTPSPTEKPLSPEHNLRRQLKEAFGRPAADSPVGGGGSNNVVVANFASADEKQNHLLLPLLPTDFLSDYASRKELGDGGDGAVLLREGETVRLTEEMFRGGGGSGSDIIVPKNVVARKQQQHRLSVSETGSDCGGRATGQIVPDSASHKQQAGNHHSKKKGTGLSGSEMGDSGISSPPPFGAPPSLAISPRPPIAEEDSGVEGEQQTMPPPPGERKVPVGGFSLLQPVAATAAAGGTVVPKVPKRDTMIRELKSKLRERFRQNGDSDDGTTDDGGSSSDDCSAKNLVSGKGLVESRRESIGPQLGKIFANGSSASGSRFSLASRSQGQQSSSTGLDLEGSLKATSANAPPALPPKVSISRNESARSNATTTFKSIYESRMNNGGNRQTAENVYLLESNASTVYDPSLPEELRRSVPAGLMFRDVASRPLTPPPDLPAKARGAAPAASEKRAECKRPTCGNGKAGSDGVFTLTPAEARQLMEAAPEDRREFLYGPGGVFGPKGPFSTPIVRYI